ncbi:hypothetical protein REPUB_Repub01dG0045500 [Reevesia pubescens]
MVIKPPFFSIILCCFLLALLFFIPHGIVAGRVPPEVKEDDNGHSKAGVRRSHTNPAPSWVGHNSPPTPRTLGGLSANCGRGRAYSSCIPKRGTVKGPANCNSYLRRC